MKKFFCYIVLLTFITNSLFAQSKTPKKSLFSASTDPFLLDKAMPLNDSEMDLLSRIEVYDLNGNVEKSIEYLKDLIKAFISQDKQISVINASFLLVEKMIMEKNLKQATAIIRDIEHRINYYLVTTKEIQKDLLLRTTIYKYLITTLNPSFYKGVMSSVVDSLNQIVHNDQNKNRMKSLMLSYFALGLAYNNMDNREKALDSFYQSAKLSNSLFDFYFYYTNSINIVNIHLNDQAYIKALNRLSILHQLFSDIRYSIYYKVKIFLYIVEVYKQQQDYLSAFSILERSYELVNVNTEMSLTTKNEMSKNIKDQMQSLYNLLPKAQQSTKKDLFVLYDFVNNQ